MIEASLFTLLQTALSGSVASRIYPGRLPQGAVLPALVYTIIDRPSYNSQTGSSNLSHPRIQVDCWTTDYDDAATLGAAVDSVLNGFRGTVGNSRIDSIIRENDRPQYDELSRTWRRILDYITTYAEI